MKSQCTIYLDEELELYIIGLAVNANRTFSSMIETILKKAKGNKK